MNKLKHLAIIMDGNGRYAQKLGKGRSFGHEKGSKVLLECAKWAKKQQIEMITYYAFSTENWKRSSSEINFLFKLPIMFFDKYFQEFIDEGICVKIIGDRSPLPPKLNKKLTEIEHLTKNNTQIIVNLAINYGGRDEIVHATQKIVEQVIKQQLTLEQIDEKTFSENLYTSCDVDLLIRTGSEFRISNFLLWQNAYAEFFISDKLWPEFDETELNKAVNWYKYRDRRFGGV